MKQKIITIIWIIIALYFAYRASRIFFYTPSLDFEKISFQTLDKEKVSLTSQQLHSTIIIFFQTWCAPCIAEMRLFQAHHKDFQFTNVYFVSDEPIDKVRALKEHMHLDSINILISEKPLQDIGIEVFPTVYVIKDKQIIEKHRGAFIDDSNIEDEIYHLKQILQSCTI